MNFLRYNLLFFLIIGTTLGFAPQEAFWQNNIHGIYESDIRALAVGSQDDSWVYAASSKAVYGSSNGGRDYKMIFRIPGKDTGVNGLYLGSAPRVLYVASDKGLYMSPDGGKSFSRIFQPSDEESVQCLSVIQDNGMVFLGTKRGLFLKGANEESWHKMRSILQFDPVYDIRQDTGHIYFSAERQLFRLDKRTRRIKKIFSVGFRNIGEADNRDASKSAQLRWIKELRVTRQPDALILASSKGMYVSFDAGDNWQRLESGSLPLEDVTSLLVVDHHGRDPRLWGILVGTEKGAYFLKDGQWNSLYKGMETTFIRDLAEDAMGKIYAATDQGVFFLSFKKALPSYEKTQRDKETDIQGPRTSWAKTQGAGGDDTKPAEGGEEGNRAGQGRSYVELNQHFIDEPGINEVHQWAVEYAEVSPEKIAGWREAARKSAWLPSLSIGADGDKKLSYSDSVSTSSGGSDHVGPDDKSWNDNLGWDVSLSWDFSELIWNPDQTSIDSRSKLMVELRDDLLDQVTRLYFERRRLQIELLTLASDDPQLNLDKQMRIDELTALIDAMTGGAFSRAIKRNLERRENIKSADTRELGKTGEGEKGYKPVVWNKAGQ